jgi:Tol biopolymer transport system component
MALFNGKIVVGNITPGDGVPSTGLTVDPDGTHVRQIGPAGDTICTTWSPTSSKVLCNVWHDPDSGLLPPRPATANPDGSGFTILDPSTPEGFFCQTWSPDGASLLCGGPDGFYTADATDLGHRTLVTGWLPAGLGAANAYGWSPDGSRILIAAIDQTDTGIVFSMKPDGSDPIRLNPVGTSVISQDFFQVCGADWSPEGSQVVMALRVPSPDGRVNRAVYVVDSDGTGLRQVTPGNLQASTAQWSPNGQWIAFTSRAPRNPAHHRRVWVIHPDGTGLTLVTPTPVPTEYFAPVWSPDSNQLVFDRLDADGTASVWVADRDGSKLHKLVDTNQTEGYDWGSAPTG